MGADAIPYYRPGLFTPKHTGKAEHKRRKRAWQLLANAFRLSNGVAKGMADAITTYAGGSGKLRIYTASQPTDPDTAIGAVTLLAELTMNATSFGAATDANPGGLITANAITADSSADATGTAAWFRLWKSDGTTPVFDGSCGTSSADMILNTLSITLGSNVSCSSATVKVPET